MDMDKPLPPGSRAWCLEPHCDWSNETPEAHRHGSMHMNLLQHVVQVYIPTCGDPHVRDTQVFFCELESGHSGDHRRYFMQWPQVTIESTEPAEES